MKCPTCGAPNKSINKACYRCGQVLDDRSVQPKGTANSLWYNPGEKKERQTPPPFWGDTAGKPNYDDKSDFIVLHDEGSNANLAQDVVDKGAPPPDNRKKIGRMDEKREVRVVVPAGPYLRTQAAYTGRRYKIKWRRLVISAVVILALSAGVGYGVFLLYRGAMGAATQLFAGNRDNADSTDPQVEKVTINGAGWHKITFFGKDGDVVMLTDSKKSESIKNGMAEFNLEDQRYIPKDLNTDKVTVSLEAIVISQDGKEKPVTVRPYEIDVPLAPLKIVEPAELENIATDSDAFFIKIKVLPGSRRIMIGNSNVTDTIDSNGYASYMVKLQPNVVNSIVISADTANFRKNVQELKVARPFMQVPITLDNEAAEYTQSSTILIKGRTDTGATIMTGDGKKADVQNGSFSFRATLKAWGWNDVKVTATSASGSSSTMTHRVYHTPSDPYYSSHAQAAPTPTDYDYLVQNTPAVAGRIYYLVGTFVNKIESETGNYYLFDFGEAGSPRYFVVENIPEIDIKVGQPYKLYADVEGTKVQNYPVLALRYYYWLIKQEVTGASASPWASASPGASASPKATNGQ